MARPKCCRIVGEQPVCRVFKPVGVPVSVLEEIVLSIDEFEAVRLADLEGLYQEQAAERMNVSRQTFGRIVESARRKVAQALVEGLALRMEGGAVRMPEERTFKCNRCMDTWSVPHGTDRPEECPRCKNTSVYRLEGSETAPRSKKGCRKNQCRRVPS